MFCHHHHHHHHHHIIIIIIINNIIILIAIIIIIIIIIIDNETKMRSRTIDGETMSFVHRFCSRLCPYCRSSNKTRAPPQYKYGLSWYGISKLKIKRLWNRLIFPMSIPKLTRRHLYIKTTPCNTGSLYAIPNLGEAHVFLLAILMDIPHTGNVGKQGEMGSSVLHKFLPWLSESHQRDGRNYYLLFITQSVLLSWNYAQHYTYTKMDADLCLHAWSVHIHKYCCQKGCALISLR